MNCELEDKIFEDFKKIPFQVDCPGITLVEDTMGLIPGQWKSFCLF